MSDLQSSNEAGQEVHSDTDSNGSIAYFSVSNPPTVVEAMLKISRMPLMIADQRALIGIRSSVHRDN